MKTLISHFYNEEFLLPFWVKHHLKMFDHGIMIDYASTDRSVEIIRELAPNWEIRPSRNKVFHYVDIDTEVMDIERGLSGWKMALNTTEFLIHPNLRNFVQNQEASRNIGVRTTGLIMVDQLSDRNSLITDESLVKQKRYGYVEMERFKGGHARCRLLHRNSTGEYMPGRHRSSVPSDVSPELFLCWFGWCPMDYVKNRKLQIKTRIPPEHFQMLKGVQHNIDEAQLEQNYIEETQHAIDLWERLPLYKNYIDQIL